jgi:hypothetical protein
VKLIPGQYNFLALPPGQTAPFNYEALQRAGMPIAPYIEHGSWETGQPALMMYGRDPYRGMMGVPMRFGDPRLLRAAQATLRNAQGRKPSGRQRLDRNQGNYSFPGHRYASQPLLGLGTVTEYLCSDTAVAKECAAKRDDTMRTSMLVAAGSAMVAGLVGALLKRPILGAVAGGVAGGLLHMTWALGYRE